MSEPVGPYTRGMLRELEFLELLAEYLPRILGATVDREPYLGRNARPDFIATLSSGVEAIVEAKSVTPNTQGRLSRTVEQLQRYADLYQKKFPGRQRPELILAVPGVLSPQHFDYLMLRGGLSMVIDGPTLRAAGANPESIDGLAEDSGQQPPRLRSRAEELLNRLHEVKPGKQAWASYQGLCGDILEFLLCPPLSGPLRERANSSKVNRRDIIFPNYATTGFWDYMRTHYAAHYVVVDAKNYVGDVPKNAVLQVANYLSAHGAGLFGIIASRNGGDRSAEITRREQWAIHRKMIVIINDDDLRQMVQNKTSGLSPSDVLRQKLEDFRLEF